MSTLLSSCAVLQVCPPQDKVTFRYAPQVWQPPGVAASRYGRRQVFLLSIIVAFISRSAYLWAWHPTGVPTSK